MREARDCEGDRRSAQAAPQPLAGWYLRQPSQHVECRLAHDPLAVLQPTHDGCGVGRHHSRWQSAQHAQGRLAYVSLSILEYKQHTVPAAHMKALKAAKAPHAAHAQRLHAWRSQHWGGGATSAARMATSSRATIVAACSDSRAGGSWPAIICDGGCSHM